MSLEGQISALAARIRDKFNTLDPLYRDGVRPATLDDAGLSAAFATGTALGIPVLIPPGSTVTLAGTVAMPSRARLILEGTIRHVAATGTALTAIGTEGATVALTANAAVGGRTVTATGHGLVAGDWFRLGSNKIYDASSTSSTIGEILRVESVAGSTITVTTAIVGGPYLTADAATVSKITFVEDIVVEGNGWIVGNKAADTQQMGIMVQRGRNVRLRVRTKDFDQRHVFLRDCIHFEVQAECDWASHATHGYGISISDACQWGRVVNLRTRNTRHAFTTNNSIGGKGLPRFIKVIDAVVESTVPASGGGAGGDALDTHTAAEFIKFIRPIVLSSSGQGINIECPIASVVGAQVMNTLDHGIAVHNESDVQGQIVVDDVWVRRAGGDGVRITNGIRGTVANYDRLSVGRVRAETVTGLPIRNTSTGSDDDSYQVTTIAADAVTVNPGTGYLVVDTEAAAATDNLFTISGGRRGQVIIVRTAGNARDVTVGNSGNIRTADAANFVLGTTRDSITLAHDGTNWIESGRADFA